MSGSQPYAPNFPQANAPPPQDDKQQAPYNYHAMQQESNAGYPQYPPASTSPYPPAGGPPYPTGGSQYPPPGFQPGYQPPQMQMQPYSPQATYQPGYQSPPMQPYMPPGYNPPIQQQYAQPAFVNQPIQQQPGPITQQPGVPGQNGWMTIPQGMPICPPGLEYLSMIDQVLVHQKVELLEAITGWETNNKFTIKNSLGQKVYWAAEQNDCCTRQMCGPIRPFDMKIMDVYNNTVIHLYRPLKCQACCWPCCLQTMEVSAPPGTVIGTIEQNWSLFKPDLSIKNASGETVLKIEGPCCTWTMCGDIDFKLLTLDGKQVGKISKQWSGLVREMLTDADHFGISFPMDLDVKMKAVMLGACFLIDAMFFEKSQNRESDGPGML